MSRLAKVFSAIRLAIALLSPTLSMLVEQHSDELETLMSRILQLIANDGEEPQLQYLYLYSDNSSSDDSLPNVEREERGDNDVVVVQNHV